MCGDSFTMMYDNWPVGHFCNCPEDGAAPFRREGCIDVESRVRSEDVIGAFTFPAGTRADSVIEELASRLGVPIDRTAGQWRVNPAAMRADFEHFRHSERIIDHAEWQRIIDDRARGCTDTVRGVDDRAPTRSRSTSRRGVGSPQSGHPDPRARQSVLAR